MAVLLANGKVEGREVRPARVYYGCGRNPPGSGVMEGIGAATRSPAIDICQENRHNTVVVGVGAVRSEVWCTGCARTTAGCNRYSAMNQRPQAGMQR